MPNVDLIANVMTWWGGPYGIFSHLYLQIPLGVYSFLMQTTINYIALLGIIFITIKESYVHKNMYIGLGMAFVMLLMTYLLPSTIVNYLMSKINKYVKNDEITALLGLIITITIVGVEYVILKNHKQSLAKFAELLINFPKKLI